MEKKGITKLPLDEHYTRPMAAYELAKKAFNARQTVYLYGASGYGKTSFVADFLARKRYTYYNAGEHIAQDVVIPDKMDKDTIIVIDDLHLIDDEQSQDAWQEVLTTLITQKNVWLIMISRTQVPEWLKTLYIRYIFVIISESELRFHRDDVIEYLEKWNLAFPDKIVEEICDQGEGYPLFIRILALRFHSLRTEIQNEEEREQKINKAIEQALYDFWDYLENYVYDQWDVELQEFLSDLSIVDEFDLELAQYITKKSNVGALLSKARQTGNFLDEYYVGDDLKFRFRSSFLKSMRRRLHKRQNSVHINDLYNSAGVVYEVRGEIPKALEIYEKAHNEDGISRLLIENTRKSPGNGHYWEMRKYYQALSDETIKNSPELMAGMCMLQSIMLNDEESDKWYDLLEEYARTQKNGSVKRMANKMLLTLRVALPHHSSTKMIDSLQNIGNLSRDNRAFFSDISITNNQPSLINGGKDFCEWTRKDKEILSGNTGALIERLTGAYGKGISNIGMAESLFEKGMNNYDVISYVNRGKVQAESGGRPEIAMVAIAIMSQLAMLNGHKDDALEMLASFKQRAKEEGKLLQKGVDNLMARFHLYLEKREEIMEWLKEAPDENDEFCSLDRFGYMTKIRVYISMGKKERALSLIEQMQEYAKIRERTYILIELAILKSIVLYRMNRTEWIDTMQEAISMAEDYHFVRILSREGTALVSLFDDHDFHWNDTAFKEQVLSECKLCSTLYPSYLLERKTEEFILSDKALKILHMQAEGWSTAEIADNLGMKQAGVKYYNQETYKKLGVNSKTAAVVEARKRKII